MRILEAIIAIVILLLFVTYLLIEKQKSEAKVPNDVSLLQETVRNYISDSAELRGYVLVGHADLIKNRIDNDKLIPVGYTYEIKICNDINTCNTALSEDIEESVYVDSFIISSSANPDEVASVYFYLWRENI